MPLQRLKWDRIVPSVLFVTALMLIIIISQINLEVYHNFVRGKSNLHKNIKHITNNLSTILPLTCHSFPNQCFMFSFNKFKSINSSNQWINAIKSKLITINKRNSNLSSKSTVIHDARFLLSLRREFMLWYNQTNDTVYNNSNYMNLLSIINELYLKTKSFRNVLYHTHIRYQYLIPFLRKYLFHNNNLYIANVQEPQNLIQSMKLEKN